MEQTNSTIENNDVATSSSNSISIPQLTADRKQEIRKKLLERQRQARLQNSNRNASSAASASSSSVASTPNTINTTTTEYITTPSNNNNSTENSKAKETEDEKPPNQEMIKKAVTFLSSPKVQSAPKSRKHSFLLSKGCTKKEIELAEKEIEEKGLLSNNSQSIVQSSAPAPVASNYSSTITQGQTPPPLPPRTYQQQNIQIVYRNPPLTRLQKVRRGLFIILFGASIIKGISIVVKKEIMRPLRELYLQYAKYLKGRNNVLNKYMLQIVEYCALFINDKNKDKVKQVKTIEEIEKEKKMIESEKKEKEVSEEKEKENKTESGGDGEGEEATVEKKKKPIQRKAIKLKIHRKKEDDSESPEGEETQLVKKDVFNVRTLSAAVQDYIDSTNDFESKCKNAIDTYAYDLERNSDLFCGSLGQTMKLSSEVYQMVSREVYYNSASSSSFYMDSYQTSDTDGDGPVSLYARVNNIKSDIRRLKGMLLNHRNFPKYKQRALANPTPVASPSSSS